MRIKMQQKSLSKVVNFYSLNVHVYVYRKRNIQCDYGKMIAMYTCDSLDNIGYVKIRI